jgi:hypothetical protein
MSDILVQIEHALRSDSDARRDEALDAAYVEIVRLRDKIAAVPKRKAVGGADYAIPVPR